MIMGKIMIKRSYCRDLEHRVNTRTNHIVSIEEYPERISDLTIDGKTYKRMTNTKIFEILSEILEEEK